MAAASSSRVCVYAWRRCSRPILHKGSIVTYKVYVKLPPEVDADALLETLRPHLAYRLTGRQRTSAPPVSGAS